MANSSSRSKTSGLFGVIVGGHLIGLADIDEIIIDFEVFSSDTGIYPIEIVYSYMENSYSKYGFIDKTGKIVIPVKYDIVHPFQAGIANVEVNGIKMFIDKQGNEYNADIFCPQTHATAQSPEIDMVSVLGGTFTMGCTGEQGSDCDASEKPAHQVTLSGFYIGKYEVTQAQWVAVMGYNPSQFKGDNLPVETVSWNDVQEFIRKLNAKTGMQYRLPTEAEWEYAARGGTHSRGTKYSGSNTVGDVAWYWDNSGNATHAVGTKAPNELGIYDMSGNVWEWCSDWYGDYPASAQTNPTGASSGSYRVYRGGSWRNSAQDVRVSLRYYDTPVSRYIFLGFRLASSSK